MKLTPVIDYGPYFAKREDLAQGAGQLGKRPTGSKVRQFLRMARTMPQRFPMIVGCSAFSAMQIYVAAAAQDTGRKAVVFVPARKVPSAATKWAEAHGAEVVTLKPGYPSQYRKAARERAEKEGGCIKWDRTLAVEDTAAQCENLPPEVKRVIIPTGSGLTAAGVMVGLYQAQRFDVDVIAIAVSDLASAEGIRTTATQFGGEGAGKMSLRFSRHPKKYEEPEHATLPDGTVLDPFYAAKAVRFMGTQPAECLWVSGLRPFNAMPHPVGPR